MMTWRNSFILLAVVTSLLALIWVKAPGIPDPPLPTAPVIESIPTQNPILDRDGKVQIGTFVGPGKQTIVTVTSGSWIAIRVLYDGVNVGDIVRFNPETHEVSYPFLPPSRWTVRAGGWTTEGQR